MTYLQIFYIFLPSLIINFSSILLDIHLQWFLKFLSKLNLILFASAFLLFNIFQFLVFHHFSLLLPNLHVPTCTQRTPVHLFPQPSRHLSPAALADTVAGVANVRHACNYISRRATAHRRAELDITATTHCTCCSPAASTELQYYCTYCMFVKLEPSPELLLYIFVKLSCTTT